MNWFEKVVNALSATMEKPTMYGWFHLVSLAVMIALLALLIWKCRNCSEKTFRIILSVAWGIIVLLEVYKQVVFSFNLDEATGAVTWDYQWYAFPFQLCSTPLYILPFVFLLPQGRFRDCFIAFLGTFSLFGGLATMFFPANVYMSIIGINIQTMIHHGLQVVLGIFVLVHEREHLNFKYFLRGIYIFVVLLAIAMGLNYLMKGRIGDESFNMFYINEWNDCSLPFIGEIIKPNVPYLAFLAIYVFGFVLIAFIIYMAVWGCIRLSQRTIRRSGMYTYEKQREDEKPRVYSYQKQKEKEKNRVYSYQKNKK